MSILTCILLQLAYDCIIYLNLKIKAVGNTSFQNCNSLLIGFRMFILSGVQEATVSKFKALHRFRIPTIPIS